MALTEDWDAPQAAGRSKDNVAQRVAAGVTIAEALGPAGLTHARDTAQRARQRARAGITLAVAPVLPGNAMPGATPRIDPVRDAPDQRLVDHLGQDICLKNRVLPWRSIGGVTIVLAPSTEHFLRMQDVLKTLFGPVQLGLIGDPDLDRALARSCAQQLQAHAEERTPAPESCRNWHAPTARNWGLALLLVVASCLLLAPGATLVALCGWAILTTLLNTGLKLASLVIHLRTGPERPTPANPEPITLPVVSILVPLFNERDIASDLLRRLQRLDYPRDRLDICLVVEANDAITRETLAATDLPNFIRAITVPKGNLQTKPRALNYALTFARGSIIGVYDAEDAPAPNQIRKVVAGFARRSPRVACLQGRLDFYNSSTNWLARCFTVEYATWFRIVLPGLQKLGLAVPLGGTTLFFRRDILEELGGWDAHNVTEDADLGVRLARHGYRTEILDTVTEEEANARPWPWIKQRSRWLKGYAVTYAVHMRSPRQLWHDLGPRGFFGVQLLFLGTLSQIVLAPLLWSFWAIPLGLPHPLAPLLSGPQALVMAGTFLTAELIGVMTAMVAVRAAGKPDLMKWAPTLHIYFPLAALAAYKGLIELASRPFYWDKTAHGIFEPTRPRWDQRPVKGMPPPLRRPAAVE